MSAASNYLENKVLDHVLRVASYTQPSGLWVALFTANTGLETNSPSAEVNGGSYGRTAVTMGAASNGSSTNSATVTFPAATANWGTVTHVAIMDAATAGNVLFWGAATASKTIETGDTFQISASNLTISLD